ncbi:unnamed protein product [Didymodactylos carnosus]|uniref:Uncharacterized protein n=1 Tax=Didymodactylos carnosus TaxID=1234261 RepID=A0A816AEE6_9BILA|nr:unnamed protein product [Didymodactylos carnosus]CAF1596383.1 unnamed protein product [Didymodactylos carnosus]CAF3591345.1 unnamed protein product [Didymodactylos carnosus]CAF4471253.1 unnamed protein product [Didymodactylos carnosus]
MIIGHLVYSEDVQCLHCSFPNISLQNPDFNITECDYEMGKFCLATLVIGHEKNVADASFVWSDDHAVLVNTNLSAFAANIFLKQNKILTSITLICFQNDCGIDYAVNLLTKFNVSMLPTFRQQIIGELYNPDDPDELTCAHQGDTVQCNGGFCQAMISLIDGNLKLSDQLCIPKNFLKPVGLTLAIDKRDNIEYHGIIYACNKNLCNAKNVIDLISQQVMALPILL